MKKVEISKALEVLKKIKGIDPKISFDDMTSEKAIDLAIEALIMQYDKAD